MRALSLILCCLALVEADDKGQPTWLPIYDVLNACTFFLLSILILTIIVVGIEINCPLMIPKSVVWLSDLAREAHEKHDQEVYLRKKMAEMEASLREKKLLSDQESGADKYKDQYFSIPGIGVHKYESANTRNEILLGHYERKLQNSNK